MPDSLQQYPSPSMVSTDPRQPQQPHPHPQAPRQHQHYPYHYQQQHQHRYAPPYGARLEAKDPLGPEPPPRKRGRPPGSKNKPKDLSGKEAKQRGKKQAAEGHHPHLQYGAPSKRPKFEERRHQQQQLSESSTKHVFSHYYQRTMRHSVPGNGFHQGTNGASNGNGHHTSLPSPLPLPPSYQQHQKQQQQQQQNPPPPPRTPSGLPPPPQYQVPPRKHLVPQWEANGSQHGLERSLPERKSAPPPPLFPAQRQLFGLQARRKPMPASAATGRHREVWKTTGRRGSSESSASEEGTPTSLRVCRKIVKDMVKSAVEFDFRADRERSMEARRNNGEPKAGAEQQEEENVENIGRFLSSEANKEEKGGNRKTPDKKEEEEEENNENIEKFLSKASSDAKAAEAPITTVADLLLATPSDPKDGGDRSESVRIYPAESDAPPVVLQEGEAIAANVGQEVIIATTSEEAAVGGAQQVVYTTAESASVVPKEDVLQMVIGATLTNEGIYPAASEEPLKISEQQVFVIMDDGTEAEGATIYTLEEGMDRLRAASEEEENTVQIFEQGDAPLVLTQGEDLSLDHCPNCETLLDPVLGGYSLNARTAEASVTCLDCDRRVVLKRAFSKRVATEVIGATEVEQPKRRR